MLIISAIFISADFLMLLPGGITGALLLFAGYELGNKFRDTESIYLTLVVAAASVFTNIGIGFVTCVGLFLIIKLPATQIGRGINYVFKADGN